MIATVSRSSARRRGAFTLLEVLVVVAILVILASVGTISVLRYLEDARVDNATVNMQTIYKQCKAYYVKTGSWPNSLNDLVTPPDGGRPYLENGMAAITDPWGQQYQYQMRQSPVSGEEEPLILTTTDRGQQIQWPRQ